VDGNSDICQNENGRHLNFQTYQPVSLIIQITKIPTYQNRLVTKPIFDQGEWGIKIKKI
jgi:hypothetical protein